jgi:crotonyl-CoA carboxylase/reductase
MKEIYEIGSSIPLGDVPRKMHAWVIRAERHGPPSSSFQQEIIDVPEIGDDEILILVMAAGVNYNGVWAALGKPVSPIVLHGNPAHVAGSDAAGIVWKIGPNVNKWKVGDEVVVQCAQYDGTDEECNGGDPMLSRSQRIWGYETPDGSFAQFSRVKEAQLLPRPQLLTWEESACYLLTLATAWRMLFGHEPNTLKPGSSVLVWGGSGGLGCMAVQLSRVAGAHAIAVVSDSERGAFAKSIGAVGVINRKDFSCWGGTPTDSEEYSNWIRDVKAFGSAIRENTPENKDVDIVFEHPGQDTFGVSTFVVKPGGMVVFCAATTGYNFAFDARHVWMRQKRIQGSHFADMKQASQANQLVCNGKLDPCLSETFKWELLPNAHQRMLDNKHSSGNMAVLVQAGKEGLGKRS